MFQSLIRTHLFSLYPPPPFPRAIKGVSTVYNGTAVAGTIVKVAK